MFSFLNPAFKCVHVQLITSTLIWTSSEWSGQFRRYNVKINELSNWRIEQKFKRRNSSYTVLNLKYRRKCMLLDETEYFISIPKLIAKPIIHFGCFFQLFSQLKLHSPDILNKNISISSCKNRKWHPSTSWYLSYV